MKTEQLTFKIIFNKGKSYPEKLIQDIISKTDLKLKDRLLEIGAGNGKATIQFAEKGYEIQIIELRSVNIE